MHLLCKLICVADYACTHTQTVLRCACAYVHVHGHVVSCLILSCDSRMLKIYPEVLSPGLLTAMPSWTRMGEHWGFGHSDPSLCVLVDSLFQIRGQAGWLDVIQVLFHVLADMVEPRTMIVAHEGARVLNGDYMNMASECYAFRPDALLVISMGNDLYQRRADATHIAAALLDLRKYAPRVTYVYGGSSSVWGFGDPMYDPAVQEVCDALCCSTGEPELVGAQTFDRIGHLRPSSIGLLCAAVVVWGRRAVGTAPIRARL